MSRKLFVGNLPFSTTDQELTELFSRAGTVESARVIRDMNTGRPRGFAFVEMATDEQAQQAIQQFHEYSLGGRNLVVNEARPKVDRPRSMAGGGGFGGGGRFEGGGGRFDGGGRGGRGREPRW